MPAKHFAVKNLFAIQLRCYQQTEQTLHLSSLQIEHLCLTCAPCSRTDVTLQTPHQCCQRRAPALSRDPARRDWLGIGVVGTRELAILSAGVRVQMGPAARAPKRMISVSARRVATWQPMLFFGTRLQDEGRELHSRAWLALTGFCDGMSVGVSTL